ncbi:MAG: HAD-IC family P-type ATPase [Candidatus Omnitrophica bacterium]|nr:HAD-IC family P-type ATPase [Candidatus Omnitrophota bacterium]MDD5553854.1 HAD-IC family P-type ATPase [Candidatus Omnitrophota bacterium]
MNKTEWYSKPVEEVFTRLSTGRSGLTQEEAKKRLGEFGHNELKFKRRSSLVRFLLQFHNSLIYILLVAASVTAGLREWPDTAVILLCVIVNVIIGFIQEGKAEAAIEALKKMIVSESTVVRDGQKKVIPSRELVPGDLVLLESGNRVPADLRLFDIKNFSTDESILTGESVPVNKSVEPVRGENLPSSEQRCIAFSGTFIARGQAQAVVINTGEKTEFGKIAGLMKQTRKIATPLTRKIADFTRFLVIAVVIIAAINFILGIIFKYTPAYSFLASVSLAVAAIPEMLPAIVVAILALASVSMAKRNALIRKLPAAETLGCATVICSDKTGTLTKSQMTVINIYAGNRDYRLKGAGYEPKGDFILREKAVNPADEPAEFMETLKAGYLCNHAELNGDKGRYNIVGDSTEGALVVSAAKAGLMERSDMIDEIPFEPEQRYMATLHNAGDKNVIYVKGSPETLLDICQNQLVEGSAASLNKEGILSKAKDMAEDALRVLAMAYKFVPKDKTALGQEDIKELTFLGLQGMIDPPREEVIEAVKNCNKAGIKVVMMTGDHVQTAKAIARQIGIAKEDDAVLTGEELSRMSDEDLYAAVEKVSVYARIAPDHKLRITLQLQKRGHVVAVTGDGVNDAPALKAADIGIAMGITGTEVSKEASDMVLADDNFASIVAAVEEGRHAWKNFQKAVLYTLPTNGGQALLVMGAILAAPFIPLFKVRLPLEPIHILWVNLADSIFLTMPLMMEPKEKDLLKSPPRSQKERIANPLFFVRVGLVSLVMALTGFAVYYHFGNPAVPSRDALRLTQAQTAAFIAVQFLHLGFLATARSIHNSAFTLNPFSNKWVIIGMVITLLNAFSIVYIPFFQSLFRTSSFPAAWWPVIILALFPGFVAVEIEKLLRKPGNAP